MRVVVAGAGISGLALARALQQRGVDVRVIEGAPRAGGKVKTERADGYVCEDGPNSYLEDAESSDLVSAAGLADRVVRASSEARRRYLYVGGRLVPVPSSPPAFLTSGVLGWPAKIRALSEILRPRGPAGRGEDESVAAFARRRLGRSVADRLVAAIVSGIYAGDPERLSLPAAFPMLAAWEREHRSLILGAARSARRAKGKRGGRGVASFRGGMQEATDTLARELGDVLRTGVAVRRVDPDGGAWKLQVSEGGRSSEIVADAVALALPAYDAAAVTAHLDAPAAEALLAIPYAPVAMVHLGFAREDVGHPLDGFGYLVPPIEGRPLLGTLFPSSIFAGRAPQGSVLLTAMAGGAIRPELVSLPDLELVEQAVGELRGLIGLRGAPIMARVVRHDRAIPQYTLGHRERVAVTSAAAQRMPGLFFAGNALSGISFSDCLRNAAPLADRIMTQPR